MAGYSKAHLDAIDRALGLRRLDVLWPDGRSATFATSEALRQTRNEIEAAIAKADLRACVSAIEAGCLDVDLSGGTRRFGELADVVQVKAYIEARLAEFARRPRIRSRRIIASPFMTR